MFTGRIITGPDRVRMHKNIKVEELLSYRGVLTLWCGEPGVTSNWS